MIEKYSLYCKREGAETKADRRKELIFYKGIKESGKEGKQIIQDTHSIICIR